MARQPLVPIINGQINSNLDIPAQYNIDQKITNGDLIDALNVTAGINFKISWLISYFKIFDGDDPIEFPKNSKITLYYEGLSWYLAGGDDDNACPRVAYLARVGSAWAAQWVEFTNLKCRPPKHGNPGEIEIDIEDLPDPLIGGC